MFKKILWPTDGSRASDDALPLVRRLARENDASIVVFHVTERLLGPHTYGYPVYLDEEETIEKIRAQAQALTDDRYDATVAMAPAESTAGIVRDIASAANRADADLIVVGSRGHTAIGNLLRGSVTQRLLQVTKCPVLVVPLSQPDRPTPQKQLEVVP